MAITDDNCYCLGDGEVFKLNAWSGLFRRLSLSEIWFSPPLNPANALLPLPMRERRRRENYMCRISPIKPFRHFYDRSAGCLLPDNCMFAPFVVQLTETSLHKTLVHIVRTIFFGQFHGLALDELNSKAYGDRFTWNFAVNVAALSFATPVQLFGSCCSFVRFIVHVAHFYSLSRQL